MKTEILERLEGLPSHSNTSGAFSRFAYLDFENAIEYHGEDKDYYGWTATVILNRGEFETAYAKVGVCTVKDGWANDLEIADPNTRRLSRNSLVKFVVAVNRIVGKNVLTVGESNELVVRGNPQ